MSQEARDTPQAQEQGLCEGLLRARTHHSCHCTRRTTYTRLLTLIPLRISFMIFKRLSLFFIFFTCREKVKQKQNTLPCEGPDLSRHLLGQTRGCRLVRTWGALWWDASLPLSSLCSLCSCHTHLLSNPWKWQAHFCPHSLGLTVPSSQDVFPEACPFMVRLVLFRAQLKCPLLTEVFPVLI